MWRISRRKTLTYLGTGWLGFLLSSGCLVVRRRADEKATHQIQQDAVDFFAQIAAIKQKAPAKYSNQYQPPTRNELATFGDVADALFSHNIDQARELAIAVGYQLVKWKDTSSQQSFFGLIEKDNSQTSSRGWGSYFINPSASNHIFVESPHILFDRFTPEIAAQVFLLSGACGFLMAGAHRHANGSGTADVCDPIASIFQAVHKAWRSKEAQFWQIHGFANPTAKGFPATTNIVLSTGTGDVSPEVVQLQEILQAWGYDSYVYNELPANHAFNQKLNGEIAGTTFSPLAATENVQGISSRKMGASFIHIEIESSIRSTQKTRERVAQAIARAIRNYSQN